MIIPPISELKSVEIFSKIDSSIRFNGSKRRFHHILSDFSGNPEPVDSVKKPNRYDPSHTYSIRLTPTRADSYLLDPSHAYSIRLIPTRSVSYLLDPSHTYSIRLIPSRSVSRLLDPTHTYSIRLFPEETFFFASS
jgi:hypothetical protein